MRYNNYRFGLNPIVEPFEVAFVETTYTVDESVGAVSVCVNLTQPQVDILDETVQLYAMANSNSPYITSATPQASELGIFYCYTLAVILGLPRSQCRCCWYRRKDHS